MNIIHYNENPGPVVIIDDPNSPTYGQMPAKISDMENEDNNAILEIGSVYFDPIENYKDFVVNNDAGVVTWSSGSIIPYTDILIEKQRFNFTQGIIGDLENFITSEEDYDNGGISTRSINTTKNGNNEPSLDDPIVYVVIDNWNWKVMFATTSQQKGGQLKLQSNDNTYPTILKINGKEYIWEIDTMQILDQNSNMIGMLYPLNMAGEYINNSKLIIMFLGEDNSPREIEWKMNPNYNGGANNFPNEAN